MAYITTSPRIFYLNQFPITVTAEEDEASQCMNSDDYYYYYYDDMSDTELSFSSPRPK